MLDRNYTKAEIIDMELYDFFELIAKSSVSEMMVIRGTLEEGKIQMLELANAHKKKMFDFDKDTFNQETFDNELTYMVQCFAMAMYLDKKIELCARREDDLVPSCFKS